MEHIQNLLQYQLMLQKHEFCQKSRYKEHTIQQIASFTFILRDTFACFIIKNSSYQSKILRHMSAEVSSYLLARF